MSRQIRKNGISEKRSISKQEDTLIRERIDSLTKESREYATKIANSDPHEEESLNLQRASLEDAKNRIDKEIDELSNQIFNTKIVDLPSNCENTVTLGDTVEIELVSDDNEKDVLTAKIVMSSNCENEISASSPVGKAIVGHKINDIVYALTPSGKQTITILSKK